MQIVRLIYHSLASYNLSKSEIKQIQQCSSQFNAINKVTGMLVYDNLRFLQLLEGETVVINDLYNRIVNDKRHNCVQLVHFGELNNRRFTEWSMGVAYMPVSKKTFVESKYGGFFPDKFNAYEATRYLQEVREFAVESM
ncbi:BLUF domain-containing protein [Catenovulum sediminis]|uniref:BLUF domain-containing protein n=1 Tax=Catenovulum sediminis TaxID=1740262 RepID=A0ABV1RHS8_9ALTE|nr:BLUF domain-containing protein [Catenovulum sediminis]